MHVISLLRVNRQCAVQFNPPLAIVFNYSLVERTNGGSSRPKQIKEAWNRLFSSPSHKPQARSISSATGQRQAAGEVRWSLQSAMESSATIRGPRNPAKQSSLPTPTAVPGRLPAMPLTNPKKPRPQPHIPPLELSFHSIAFSTRAVGVLVSLRTRGDARIVRPRRPHAMGRRRTVAESTPFRLFVRLVNV